MKNQERLKKYLLEIKGDRTMREWANDTGVSAATLSNYINDKVRGSITPQTLRKLIEPKTNPRGNVSYEELLAAGGFDELKASNDMLDYMLFLNTTGGQEQQAVFVEQNNKREGDLRLMKMLVESEAAVSKGRYEVVQDDRYADKFNYVMLSVNNNTNIKKSIIVLDNFKLPYIQMGLRVFKFGRLLYIEPEEGLKVSLFTGDRLFYDQLLDEKPKLAYKYDFSVIYFNKTNINASGDLYLSCSNESDMFDMFEN